MPWQEPKIDWSSEDGVTDGDMNRIEKNTLELQTTKVNRGCTWGDLKDVTS